VPDPPDPFEVLRIFVAAHDQPDPRTGNREPIWDLLHMGGTSLQHHALEEPRSGIDEALLEDMQADGLITIDYRQHNWNITPTPLGRQVVQEHERLCNQELESDPQPLIDAVAAQSNAEKPAWVARSSPDARCATELLGAEQFSAARHSAARLAGGSSRRAQTALGRHDPSAH
jgi:hypothetical protein